MSDIASYWIFVGSFLGMISIYVLAATLTLPRGLEWVLSVVWWTCAIVFVVLLVIAVWQTYSPYEIVRRNP